MEPMDKSTTYDEPKEGIKEGSSNIIRIYPKQGSNRYMHRPEATNTEVNGEDYEEDQNTYEPKEKDYDNGLENSEDTENFENEYDHIESGDNDGEYDNDIDREENGEDNADYHTHAPEAKETEELKPNSNINPLLLEKEDHNLDLETAKFDESEIKLKAEKVVKDKKKFLDAKFLKELETPVKPKSFSSKQEGHSPYSFTGHRLSHSKPFRSFKEYLEKSQNKVKVVSTSSKSSEDQTEDDGFNTGAITDQKIAKNSPPTDPAKYNTEGTIEEDIVKGIPRMIKKKIKRLPHAINEKAHKVKNIII